MEAGEGFFRAIKMTLKKGDCVLKVWDTIGIFVLLQKGDFVFDFQNLAWDAFDVVLMPFDTASTAAEIV